MSPCVLFDLDGTLTDPREGILASLRFACEGLGIAPPPETTLLACIGPPLEESFAALLPDPSPAQLERAAALYREHYLDAGAWRADRVLPGIPELLAAVEARGWRSAIATSKGERSARRIADHLGLCPPIGEIHGKQPDGRLATKPELLRAIFARHEPADPGRFAMVGDRRHDVEGARAVGIASVGVTWGFGERSELEAAGATWICDSPDAALAALERHFSS